MAVFNFNLYIIIHNFLTLSATSDGTSVSLSNHEGGHCASSNMKMTIYICNGSSGENFKVKR